MINFAKENEKIRKEKKRKGIKIITWESFISSLGIKIITWESSINLHTPFTKTSFLVLGKLLVVTKRRNIEVLGSLN